MLSDARGFDPACTKVRFPRDINEGSPKTYAQTGAQYTISVLGNFIDGIVGKVPSSTLPTVNAKQHSRLQPWCLGVCKTIKELQSSTASSPEVGHGLTSLLVRGSAIEYC